ncbi:MAG TPA: IPT/TIG domain-containing protein [Verrucomicrobiae bacterium]|nr:IPT/TIG domain-containing protein [Verrucomicrobiae bacterium]
MDEYNNAVTIIDTKTHALVSTISNFIPGIPNSFSAGLCNVAVTPDGTKAFVGNYNSAPGGAITQLNVVTEIDLTAKATTTAIPISPNQGSCHLAISPDNMFAYVPINTGQAFEMLVIDIAKKVVAGQYGIDGSPGRMAISADGMSLWAPYMGDTKVDVLNPATGARINQFDLGSRVQAVVLSPDGTTAYVSSDQVSSIFAISVASGKVSTISTVAPGATGFGATFIDLATSPDGKRLSVTQNPSPLNNIEIIDLATGKVTTPFPESPSGLDFVSMPFALSPDGAKIFTLDANSKGDSIAAGSTTRFALLGKNALASPANTFFVCGMATQPAAQMAPPAPVITSVVNDASFRPPIVASSWVAIGGTDLSGTTRSWGLADFVWNRLPTSLDGVSVTINGIPAYVHYISPGQVNVLAPDDAATGNVTIQVKMPGERATRSWW